MVSYLDVLPNYSEPISEGSALPQSDWSLAFIEAMKDSGAVAAHRKAKN